MRTCSSLLLHITLLFVPLLVNGFSTTRLHQATATANVNTDADNKKRTTTTTTNGFVDAIQHAGLVLSFSVAILLGSAVNPVLAVDFVSQDISGQDFSGQDLSGKDFSGAIAKGTNFAGASLIGTSFQKANLIKADFTGANLQNAKLQNAILDESIFKDVTGQRATFSESILDIGVFENADLTDSIWPSKLRLLICDMNEVKGENKVTGADTRISLMCTAGLNFSS